MTDRVLGVLPARLEREQVLRPRPPRRELGNHGGRMRVHPRGEEPAALCRIAGPKSPAALFEIIVECDGGRVGLAYSAEKGQLPEQLFQVSLECRSCAS